MALTPVTARARTRGKTPKEFNFQAVGRLQPRKVLDKHSNPVVVDADGNQVDYSIDKDKDGNYVLTSKSENIKLDDKGNPVISGSLRFVEVDDVDTKGITDNFKDVLDLFGALDESIRDKRSPQQCVIDFALDGYNQFMRDSAAPVTAVITEDELTPIVKALVEKKILPNDEAGTTWRRTMTSGAKVMEVNRLEYVQSSPQYKRLLKAGWTPEPAAA